MPLYKTITIDESTNLLIWKIEESYELLCEGIQLTPDCQNRVDKMKSDIHKRGFMSIRHLLAISGYTDFDLFYDDFGKPYLKDDKHISITHSFEFSGIIISDKPVGIDIEKQREKIHRIAHKFVNSEKDFVDQEKDNKTRLLTIIWGAKESLYKLYAKAGLSFEQHIHIMAFDVGMPFTVGSIHYKEDISHYDITFIEFEGFTCVYALPYIVE
ncbi:4'-phosphopantetheinyl transferase superfamily protein [Aquimarina sp. RZ0]|uniref:4'-phosphopantetheinyl transferase family protein n=1 Tax=Aquimarina sp. RZ0 TaxID=2607730 RepID=UPI0011F226CF|nr:4'-phosphopantetheinyl transferase superfamily protein [Aquimarina sp. RZ0]KAA1243780.1 4'-phosphopantetheinyl transferase superfamily protein [Aquimarina sp. RZ0]KAA1243784.1 4'-phosphopantetheinyl transferase superfamily protein [Aquimarina sp. RZ0]